MARTPDVIVRDGPALSADSDAPMIAATPPPPLNASNDLTDQDNGTAREVGPNNPADPPDGGAGDQPGADQTQQQQRGDGDRQAAADETALENDAEGNPKYPDGTPPWMKREITIARNRQRAADQAAADAQRQLEATRGEIGKLTEQVSALTAKITQPPAATPVAPAFAEPRPQRDAYPDPAAYEAALVAWGEAKSAFETEARLNREAAERDAEAKRVADAEAETKRREAAEAELATITSAWNTRRNAAIAEIPDYVAIAENPDLGITVPMAHAIYTAENGPAMAYHLGKNPAELARIAALANPGAQIFEMGKLAATLAAQPKVVVSKTPAPIRPLAPAGNAADSTSDQEPSMDDWGERRTKEIRAERKPLINATQH